MAVYETSSLVDLKKKMKSTAEDIKRRINSMRGKEIIVGIPPDSTYPPHTKSTDSLKYPNGIPIAVVANMIEYGIAANGAPMKKGPRPFIRLAVEENEAKWARMLVQRIRDKVRRYKRPNLRPILISVAEEIQKDIRKKMLQLDVWDTGRMHSSISILKVK